MKLPQLPQLPKLPELPQLPQLPKLPELPQLPQLPKLPSLFGKGGGDTNVTNTTINNNNNYYGGDGFDSMTSSKNDYSRIFGSQNNFPTFHHGNSSYAPESKMKDFFPHGSVNIDTGSGDDVVIINGQAKGPLNVDTGSGDDRVVINAPPESPIYQPAAPVAADENGSITGDPHFVGGDGGKYDVQGKPNTNYDLLSDKGLQVRGRFDAWGKKGATVVGETGVTVGEGMNSDYVNFRKNGTASINGQAMEEGKLYQLADGGTAKLEKGELTTTTGEGYSIKQTAQKGYINMSVNTGKNGVDNGRMPSGLLGQTFDADSEARNGAKGHGAQGEGAIVGEVSDYERSSLDPIDDHRGTQSAKEWTLRDLMDKLEMLKNSL